MSQYGYKIAVLNNGSAGTGTLSISASSLTCSGSGTAFTTELSVGGVIYAAGQKRIVAAVGNNTSATMEAGSTTAISGASFTVDNLTNVETFMKAPKSYFRPYVDLIDLGDGSSRGMGLPVAEWRWGFITLAQHDSLRAYCSGTSAKVIIRTRTNDSSDNYETYFADMIWPDETDKQAGRRLNFTIQFRNLYQT